LIKEGSRPGALVVGLWEELSRQKRKCGGALKKAWVRGGAASRIRMEEGGKGFIDTGGRGKSAFVDLKGAPLAGRAGKRKDLLVIGGRPAKFHP